MTLGREGKKMWKEFKEFILRGNVIELAVGLVMGAAFTAIVTALVDHIIMPVIAGISGSASVADMAFDFNGSLIGYGAFLQAIIDFLLIAIVLFLAIKALNTMAARLKREEDVEEEEDQDIPSTEDYLKEIRDLLAAQQAETKVINHDREL